MIRYYIVQNIDALISIFGGVVATVAGYKAVRRGDDSTRTRLLKILGPCVTGFGLVWLCINLFSPIEWQKASTSDGIANASFPGKPEVYHQVQKLAEQTVTSNGWIYAVPGKDISLRVTYSDSPITEAVLPHERRFNFMKQFLTGQGFKVLNEGTAKFGDTSGFFIQMQHSESKAIVWMHISYVGNRVYRAVCSAGDGFHEDALVTKFMDSFQVRSLTSK